MLRIARDIARNPVQCELEQFDCNDGTCQAQDPSSAAVWRAITQGLAEVAIVGAIAVANDGPQDAIDHHVVESVTQAQAKRLPEDAR